MTWFVEPYEYPSPAAAAAFVRDYETARGRRFDTAERAVAAATATYGLSYASRCEHACDRAGEPATDSARRALRAYAPDALAALLAAD